MIVFQNSTDASGVFSPNSAAGSNNLNVTSVGGNLSDIMKNKTIFRVSDVAQHYLKNIDLKPTSASLD